MVYRPPDTATHSYVEIGPETVLVGDVCQFAFVNEADEILAIVPAVDEAQPLWAFVWGTGPTVAYIPDPDIPGTVGTSFITRRYPDPSLRGVWETPDGARWIYYHDKVGVYFLCINAGTVADEGDLIRGDEPLYVPVDGPADVEVGNAYRFVLEQTVTVDAVYPPGDPGGSPDGWVFDFEKPGGGTDGVLVPVGEANTLGVRIYLQVPKPAAESVWMAPDGSEWVWPGGVSYYRCFAAGARWPLGSCADADEIGELSLIE